MTQHKFIESNPNEKYHRVIFCEKCGRIAWDFNDPRTQEKYQSGLDSGCIAANPSSQK